MENKNEKSYIDSDRNKRFADLLFAGVWSCLFFTVLAFGAYLLGIEKPYVPLEKIPNSWVLSAETFTAEASIPLKWGWLRLLGYGDYLNFPPLLLQLGLVPVCLLAAAARTLGQKDRSFLLLCLVQLLIFFLAASGFFM